MQIRQLTLPATALQLNAVNVFATTTMTTV
jgi:hypothetical protein